MSNTCWRSLPSPTLVFPRYTNPTVLNASTTCLAVAVRCKGDPERKYPKSTTGMAEEEEEGEEGEVEVEVEGEGAWVASRRRVEAAREGPEENGRVNILDAILTALLRGELVEVEELEEEGGGGKPSAESGPSMRKRYRVLGRQPIDQLLRIRRPNLVPSSSWPGVIAALAIDRVCGHSRVRLKCALGDQPLDRCPLSSSCRATDADRTRPLSSMPTNVASMNTPTDVAVDVAVDVERTAGQTLDIIFPRCRLALTSGRSSSRDRTPLFNGGASSSSERCLSGCRPFVPKCPSSVYTPRADRQLQVASEADLPVARANQPYSPHPSLAIPADVMSTATDDR